MSGGAYTYEDLKAHRRRLVALGRCIGGAKHGPPVAGSQRCQPCIDVATARAATRRLEVRAEAPPPERRRVPLVYELANVTELPPALGCSSSWLVAGGAA